MGDEACKVTGGCLCGAVRYEAEAYLAKAYFCHCRMCQKSSGAPAEIAVPVKPGTLVFSGEEPTYYRSSPFGRRGFCRLCGSRLVWMSPDRPEWTNLSVGCLDHPEDAVPSEHCCIESQLPWYRFDDGLPRRRGDELPDLVAAWAETSG
jgi:hypothetical protein